MTDQPDNILLQPMRRFDEKLDRVIETQQWVRTSMKTASVTPPDCKLGKT